MVSAQLSFATAHGDLVGTLQAISEHFFQTEKYRQQFYKIISYPLLLIVFDSRHCWYSAIFIAPINGK